MHQGLKDALNDEIENLMTVTMDNGWRFEIQLKSYPIVITFEKNQISMFDENGPKEQPRIKFIFAAQTIYEMDQKAKIPKSIFNKFEKSAVKIVSLYTTLFHACFEENTRTLWNTAIGDRMVLIDKQIYDGFFTTANARECLAE
jgi:hypothetical protein